MNPCANDVNNRQSGVALGHIAQEGRRWEAAGKISALTSRTVTGRRKKRQKKKVVPFNQ